jgi:nitroreductase
MVIEPIIWRRSIREYSDEPILDESIEEIIKAAQFAPTAVNKRAVEFVVVKAQSVKKSLSGILKQDFISKAPVLLVPVCNVKAAVLPEADLAIASAFIMIQAAALGLGTVWKHVDQGQREAVGKALGLPKDYILVNLIPLGYPLNELADHSDAEFDRKKIHFDKF